jgi:hypothetical protein
MIIDARNEFCDAVALNTGAANTYLIGSQIDLGAANDMGSADPDLYLVITVDTAVDSAGDGVTLAFTLASDDSDSVHVSTSSVHLRTKVFTQAEMTAGAVLYVGKLPFSGVEPYERYLGLLQTTAVEAVTAGKINAFLTKDPQAWLAMADGI